MNLDNLILLCHNCGTKNRVPTHRLKDHPVCGKCKTSLSVENVYDHVVDVTDQTFQNEIISYTGPVLLDCWAPWCGPCKMVTPILDQLAKTYAGRIKVAKLNVDENQQTAARYNVQSIPTMLFFKHGQVVNSLIGAQPKTEIERQVKALL